jgi:beta-glucanase (GH16 family)
MLIPSKRAVRTRLKPQAAMSAALLCAAFFAAASCVSAPPAVGSRGEHGRLLWSDEFEAPGRPDPVNWMLAEGGSGWDAQELQCYASDPGFAEILDGRLAIRAIRERKRGRDYASAMLSVTDQFGIRYGRIELRAKLPAGKGLLSFARLVPVDEGAYPPFSGELDIFEQAGLETGLVRSSLNDSYGNTRKGNARTAVLSVPDCADAFHTYAVEWGPERIDFYLDETRCLRVENPEKGMKGVSVDGSWPFDAPFRLVLGLAVGGSWAGSEGIGEEALPGSLEIDWVRAWDLGIKR